MWQSGHTQQQNNKNKKKQMYETWMVSIPLEMVLKAEQVGARLWNATQQSKPQRPQRSTWWKMEQMEGRREREKAGPLRQSGLLRYSENEKGRCVCVCACEWIIVCRGWGPTGTTRLAVHLSTHPSISPSIIFNGPHHMAAAEGGFRCRSHAVIKAF